MIKYSSYYIFGDSRVQLHIRSLLIAFNKIKYIILWIILFLLMGTLSFYFCYYPEYDQNFSGSLYDSLIASITLLIGLDVFNYPFSGNFIIQIMYITLPILGMGLIGVGILEFGLLIFTKRTRISLWNKWSAKRMDDHTILVGLGNIGKRILTELQNLEEEIVIITLEEQKNELVKELLENSNVSVLFGDAKEEHILKNAGVENARAILITTNDDLVNLKIASVSKKLNPTIRTVTRAFDQDFARKISELFDIDKAISTSAIAAPAFVAASYEDGIIQTLYKKEGERKRYHLAELIIKNSEEKLSIEQLEDRYSVTVIAVNNEVHPQEDKTIDKDDKLLILADLAVFKQLKLHFS